MSNIDNQWIFFHCIKKTHLQSLLLRSQYECKHVKDIIDIPVPTCGKDEYIIPICAYTPESWKKYYVTKFLQDKIDVIIIK